MTMSPQQIDAEFHVYQSPANRSVVTQPELFVGADTGV